MYWENFLDLLFLGYKTNKKKDTNIKLLLLKKA